MASRSLRKGTSLRKLPDPVEQAIGSIGDVKRDTEYLLSGVINAKDAPALGNKLLKDRSLRRSYSSLALLPRRDRQVDRRRFLKYAGATATVVGGSALGLDYLLKPQSDNSTQTTVSSRTKFESERYKILHWIRTFYRKRVRLRIADRDPPKILVYDSNAAYLY
jgi:hypothetical protein